MTLLILWKEKNQLLGLKNEVGDRSVFLIGVAESG